MRDLTALVLAGNSFIGRALAAAIRQHGLRVIATARSPLNGFARCDLTEPGQVEELISSTRPDWVIQCAGATSSQTAAEMNRLHVGGTVNVLGAVARCSPSARVVLFGSAAEYGNVEASALPVTEVHPARPTSVFGQSKLAQLRAAEQAAAELNLRVLVVRPFNILGPGLPDHYLAGALARQLLQGLAEQRSGPFSVANAGATRDWVDARDVAAAIMGLLADAELLPGEVEVYNVASGEETSVLTLAEELCRLAGSFTAVPAAERASRSGIVRSCGDAGKIRRAIGWQPQISWQQSVEELWNAARSAFEIAQAPVRVLASPRSCSKTSR